jgi:rubrerythrin
VIDTREGLVDALEDAAELEHCLMVEYLYAALSLKKDIHHDVVTGQQMVKIQSWEGQILEIAREEMMHLATVCNLLAAIGGAPHFDRPRFPRKAQHGFPFELTLVPFGDESLHRFIRAELPKGLLPDPPAPTWSCGIHSRGSYGDRCCTADSARCYLPEACAEARRRELCALDC